MNIKGIGVDIEEIGRFRKLPYKRHGDFYAKIFTSKEIAYCLSKKDPYPHFAARFAGKEAVIKAIQSSVYRAKQIEIINQKNGMPKVRVAKLGGKLRISLSHTKDRAIAFVIWSN